MILAERTRLPLFFKSGYIISIGFTMHLKEPEENFLQLKKNDVLILFFVIVDNL